MKNVIVNVIIINISLCIYMFEYNIILEISFNLILNNYNKFLTIEIFNECFMYKIKLKIITYLI